MEAWGLPPEEGRASWDALVTLVAVRGVEAVGARVEGRGGVNWVDANGTNIWLPGTDPRRRQSYLVLRGDEDHYSMEADTKAGRLPQHERDLQREIERLLCRPPRAPEAEL